MSHRHKRLMSMLRRQHVYSRNHRKWIDELDCWCHPIPRLDAGWQDKKGVVHPGAHHRAGRYHVCWEIGEQGPMTKSQDQWHNQLKIEWDFVPNPDRRSCDEIVRDYLAGTPLAGMVSAPRSPASAAAAIPSGTA